MEKYDPIRMIGEGSFGKVYLMRDKVKRKFICVKVIKIKNIPKKERESTKMEVDLLRRLHHPNIVRYVDSFLSKNKESLCIVMEYCDGGDLASQVKAAKNRLFSEDKILHWFVQITLGLHYMHNNKVLHRDLKTQNVFLLGNGRLVLGDLGICKVLEGTMDFAQTCIGTPYYMSPEIFKNKPYSYKSDVWALGCILYEMTTLNHAFDAQSLNGLAQKIIKGRYPPIHSKYSKHLKELIDQMLQINPQQRPDVDQILRRPFIKKHICNFFTDIASRPSQSLGEGTMIVRAAAGGPMEGFGGDVNMVAFRQQLQELNMMGVVNDALNKKPTAELPAEPVAAKKLCKEQSKALKREEDHKKMVESALEKLKLEREARTKLAQQAAQNRARGRGGVGAFARNDVPPMRQQHPPSKASHNPSNPPLSARDRKEPVRVQDQVNHHRREGRRSLAGQADLDKERLEHEKRREAAQHRVKEEERKREEMLVARKREDEAMREEACARQKRDQQRAQQEAAARREQQKERERERQKEEIDQLKRDKLELDRRAAERDKVRDNRREEESRKMGSDAKEIYHQQRERDRNVGRASERRDRNDRADDKDSQPARRPVHQDPLEYEGMSAFDKVMARKQERLHREEQEKLDGLKIVGGGPRGGVDAKKVPVADSPKHYEFESAGARAKQKRNNMDMVEINDKLPVANARFDAPAARAHGGVSSSGGNANEEELSSASEEEGCGYADEVEESVNFEANGDDEEVEEDLQDREEELKAELTMATRRCNDLKQTLVQTKSFIENKFGAPITRAGRAAPVPGTVVSTIESSDEEEIEDEEEVIDQFDEEDEYEEEEYEVTRSNHPSSKNSTHDHAEEKSTGGDVTPRRRRPPPVVTHHGGDHEAARGGREGYRQNTRHLADPPSPSGRLGDRIYKLRMRCVETLGRHAFDDAYYYLKSTAAEMTEAACSGYNDDFESEKFSRIRSILGEGKAHYIALIEQLIFMEDTHNV